MREYRKPVMQVERYVAKNAVAWGCTEVDVTDFPAQTVDCVINGTENIFGDSSCQYRVDQIGTVGVYGGQYYLVWYDEGVDKGNNPDTRTLTAIEQAIYPAAVGKPNWHAGPVSAETYKKWNSTS